MPRQAIADPANRPTSTRRYRSWPAAVTTTEGDHAHRPAQRHARVTAERDHRLRHRLGEHEQHAAGGEQTDRAMAEVVFVAVQYLDGAGPDDRGSDNGNESSAADDDDETAEALS